MTPRRRPSDLACRIAALLLMIAAPIVGAADDSALLSANQLKQLSLEQLLAVEVTSVSRYPEKWLEVPSAIQVIQGDEIVRSGATSIPEALRLAPNLEVAQKNPHDWGISARGFNTALANKLLVMIDGRTVYTPLFSGVFWDVQDYLLEDLDRIEVVSGPGATLWGANAVNGVINITTKNAKDTLGTYAEAGGGSELRSFAAVRYGTVVAPSVYMRVYAQTSDRDNAEFANGTSAPDAVTMHRAGFRVDADVAEDVAATVQGDIYQGSEDIVTGGAQKVSGGNLLGRWSRSWSADSDLVIQAYYDHTYLRDPITNTFGSAKYITDRLDTFDIDAQHRFPIARIHELVWGVSYRLTHDDVHNAPNTAFLPARADHQLFSAFAQDEVTLPRNLFLTAGTKLEHNDYTGLEIEPSLRLAWRAAPTHTFWAAVARAVRMPSRYDRDIFQPNPPPLIASGDKNFQSETLIAYELGYRAQVATGASASVSAYYNVYDKLRSFGPAPGTTRPPYTFGNHLDADAYGLEASAQFQLLSWWRLRGSYNYLVEHVHVKTGYLDLFGGLNEISDPKHQVTLASSWDLPGRVSLDLDARWVDALPTTNGTVPSYAEADARIAWRLNDRIEFSISGRNLLHARHPEFGIATPRREEIQRTVFAKVAIRF